MAKFEFEVDFSKSIREANSFSDKLGKMKKNIFSSKVELLNIQKSLKESNSQYQKMGKSAQEIAGFNEDMAVKLQAVEWQLKDVNEQQDAFNELISHGGDGISDFISRIPLVGGLLAPLFQRPLDRLNDLRMSMERFNGSFNTLTRNGQSLDGVFSGFFQNFASNTKQFSKNFSAAFGAGTTAAMGNMKVIFAGLLTSAQALIPVIASIAWPILAVVAAIYLLKKVWDLNLGGIQKLVFGLGGAIKDVLGRSVVNLQQSMQKLGPVFKIVFTPIFTVLKGLVILVGALFDAIFIAIQPILDLINEIFAPFADLTGDGNVLLSIFKALGAVLKFIGGLIALILKPIVFLMKPIVQLIAMGVDKLKEWGAAIMELLEPLLKVWDALKKIYNTIVPDKVIEATGAEAGVSARERPSTTISNSTSRVVNNSPNITIQTSREITPQGARGMSEMLGGMINSQSSLQ